MNNLFDVSNKVVCIAGGSRGLGKAIAEAFASFGSKVVIGSWDSGELCRTKEALSAIGRKVEGIEVDVSKRDECRKLVEFTVATHERIDVMICNAGVDIIKPAEDYTEEEWDKILDINLKGAFFCAQFAAQHMLKKKRGSILFTSSIAGAHGVPGLTPYAASKGGMELVTRTTACEWANKGVRVNAIAPGYIDNIMDGVDGDEASEYQQRAMARTPMGRRGLLKEFVGSYIFLASDAASYITGTTIYVDGGYHAA